MLKIGRAKIQSGLLDLVWRKFVKCSDYVLNILILMGQIGRDNIRSLKLLGLLEVLI